MNSLPPASAVSKLLGSYVCRFSVYAFVTLITFQCVYEAIKAYGPLPIVLENGPIESAQVVLAVIGACGMFVAALSMPAGRSGLVFWGAAISYAAARESDTFFETMLFDDAYKWVVGLPMLMLVLFVCFVDRRRLVDDTIRLMQHPAATMFGMAGVFLCFVVQLFDRPGMWTGVGSSQSITIMKSLIEENCELFAYLLIAFAGIEFATFGLRQRRALASEAGNQEGEETLPLRCEKKAA